MINDADRPRLSHAAVLSGGEGISFRIERGDGATLDIACTLEDLNDIFQYLAAAAKHAASLNEAISGPGSPKEDLTPIEADGLGLAFGSHPDQSILLVRLAGFHMSFAIPNSALSGFSRELSQIAMTISAERHNPS